MTSPEEKKPVPPEPTKIFLGNDSLSGLRAQRCRAQWLISDLQRPCLVADTAGDIYLHAAGNKQMMSDSQMHKVTEAVTRFMGSVARQIEGDQSILIGGNSSRHVNGDQKIEIVGGHALNTAAAQTTIVGAGQEIEVTGGKEIAVLAGNLKEHVVGDHKTTIAGDETVTIGAEEKVFTNDATEETYLGDALSFKTSTENSVTGSMKVTAGLSGEASVTLGLFEKATVGAHFEMTSGSRNTKNIGRFSSTARGPRWSLGRQGKSEAAAISEVETQIESWVAKVITEHVTISSKNASTEKLGG